MRKGIQILIEDTFIEILGRLVIVFDNIGLLYFDGPYRPLFDNLDRATLTDKEQFLNFDK